MAIEFRCTSCGKLLRTGDDTAGKKAQCPACGAIVAIPGPGSIATGAAPTGGENAPAPGPSPFNPFGATQGAQPIPPGGGPGGPPGAVPPESSSSSPAMASPFASAGPQPQQAGSENPYQAPSAFSDTVSGGQLFYSDLRVYAAKRVSGPATALIVTGALGLALHVIALFVNLMGLGLMGAMNAPAGPAGNGPPLPMMIQGPIAVASSALGIVVSIVIIMGATKMKRLESYGLGMASSIIAMVPCISPCCVLGLPFGIWSLVVLNDAQVKAAFSVR